MDKSDLTPSQDFVYVGVHFRTSGGVCCPPPDCPLQGLQPAPASSDCSSSLLVVSPGGAQLSGKAGASGTSPHLADSLLPSPPVCDRGPQPRSPSEPRWTGNHCSAVVASSSECGAGCPPRLLCSTGRSLHGCLHAELGGSCCGLPCRRAVVAPGTVPFDKLPGTPGSLKGSPGRPGLLEGQVGSCRLGQHNNGSLHQPSGGHSIHDPHGPDCRPLCVGAGARDVDLGPVTSQAG